MPVYRVNLAEPLSETGGQHFAIVETHHSSVDEIMADLVRGPLCMDQLQTTRHHEVRTFEITARRRVMLTLAGVASIHQPLHRYVEYNDVQTPPPTDLEIRTRSET